MIRRYLFILICLFAHSAFAQNKQKLKSIDSTLIQFSGLLLSSDSLYPIQFAYIYIAHKPYGNHYTNLDGYFSFVAQAGDTIVFTHAEYNPSRLVIPDSLKSFKYSVVKLMTKDTVYLPGFTLKALPSRAVFDDMFVKMEIPNDDIQRAKNNLQREEMREQSRLLNGTDASEAYKNMARQYASAVNYSAGQIPANNLLNPFAWAQFFEAWKRGDYKRKKPVR
jgi:hypothetical protein